MDDYAGRVLADRYRLPLPPSDEYELTETRAFDTYSGQEVLVRQVPLPEVVEAEVLDAEGLPEGFTARERGGARVPGARRPGAGPGTSTRRPADPVVRRALEAAQAAARIPDHPRLDQVFDVFAEGGSLWIVSELVAARPLAALLAERPLTPYRAAEVAADVLTALRALHAHGWVHRNITARTVLVCDDGRVMLTGLAVGAAEEALCGYDPVPPPEGEDGGDAVAPGGTFAGPNSGPGAGFRPGSAGAQGASGPYGSPGGPGGAGGPSGPGGAQQRVYGGPAALRPPAGGTRPGTPAAGAGLPDPEAARRAAIQARVAGGLPAAGAEPVNGASGALGDRGDGGGDIRAARAGAIAAYRAGARAAARVQEEGQNGRIALPGARPPAAGDTAGGSAAQPHTAPATPPGQIADPYGVRGGTAWHGATPRPSGPDPSAPAPGARDHAPLGPAAPAGWDDPAGGPPPHRGPATALAAERARQARMAVVGAVTERWAPEQAGPVHENWQLAAPIGPATDLWALGALLFRAVQGHAPYPEESTAELVQMVCAEPPAFAEECGPLRPVVESLLRQDPTERPDVEELRGWLRSLVRSAPEPEAGVHVIAAPPADPSRLPIVRRRGELVRRRRAGLLPANSPHGRHKRARQESRSARSGSPRSLGRTLLLLILLLLAGAVAYAMLFMPKAGSDTGSGPAADRTGAAGDSAPASGAPEASSEPRPDQTTPGDDGDADGGSPTQSSETQSGGGTQVADGFTLRTDPAGFQVAVANGWERTPGNGRGQVVYSHGDFQLIVVPGRDSAAAYGSDPMVYQREKEYEIQPYRDSTWATASGLKTIQVGGRTMAEGQFTWTGADGRELYVRNLAVLVDGRYHVVQVRGPEAERDEVTRLYEQASATYRPGN